MSEHKYQAAIVMQDFERNAISVMIEDKTIIIPVEMLTSNRQPADDGGKPVMAFDVLSVAVDNNPAAWRAVQNDYEFGKELISKYEQLKVELVEWYVNKEKVESEQQQ